MLVIPTIGKPCPELGGFVTRTPFVPFTGGSKPAQQLPGMQLRLMECLHGLGSGNSIGREAQCVLKNLHGTGRTSVKGGVP